MEGLKPIRCEHDGASLEGFFASPPGDGPFPTVLVMHSGRGLGQQVLDKVKQLAELGYMAIAPDMFGAGADISTLEAAGRYYADLVENTAKLRARTVAWFDVAAARDDVDETRIAALGYCFGGKCVLELARSGAAVKAVSSFHGILTTDLPAEPGIVRAIIAAHCGMDDPYAPSCDINALRAELMAANARYQITEFSGVAHGFTDPDSADLGREGIRYDPIADRVSWAATLALFETQLRG